MIVESRFHQPSIRDLLADAPHRALPAPDTKPMLATSGSLPSRLGDFGYEVKWDGYRALARWDGARFNLCSRNGIELGGRFPEIVPLRKSLRFPVMLDGEIVAMGKDGRPSFSALQTRMPGLRGARSGRTWDGKRHQVQYMIFDILHCQGRSLCSLPYTARRSVLESLNLAGPAWQSPPVHPDGPELLKLMGRTGQEGLIAKRLSSHYLIGRRSPEWIKVKINQSEEFLIVGFWSSGKHGLSSLLLGCYVHAADARAGRHLKFCGKVGTGFSEDDRIDLEQALTRLSVEKPACEGDLPRGQGIIWCRPVLVAQIHFTEWTHEGSLRHPVFKGLRSDKNPREIICNPQERSLS